MLAEAVAVGTAGSALGVAAGLGLAELLKGLFDAAGFALPAGGLSVTGGSITVSLLTGIVVTIAVSLVPALRASRVSPLEALRESATTAGPAPRRRVATGLVLLLAGAGHGTGQPGRNRHPDPVAGRAGRARHRAGHGRPGPGRGPAGHPAAGPAAGRAGAG